MTPFEQQVQDALLRFASLGGDISVGDEEFIAAVAAAIVAGYQASNGYAPAGAGDEMDAALIALRGDSAPI